MLALCRFLREKYSLAAVCSMILSSDSFTEVIYFSLLHYAHIVVSLGIIRFACTDTIEGYSIDHVVLNFSLLVNCKILLHRTIYSGLTL